MFATHYMHENFNAIIEIAGTIAFAMSGAFAAMNYKLDPFGVFIIAFATSVGGGTIRDLLLDVPIFWMYDMVICLVIFIACSFAMIFKSIENSFKNTLFIFDSLGLGLFTIIGMQKGIDHGLNPIICLTLGTITGCFGGVLRDILINRIPLLLRSEVYATACIVGGVMFLILKEIPHLSQELVQLFTVLTIVLIRIVAVKLHLELPKFYIRESD